MRYFFLAMFLAVFCTLSLGAQAEDRPVSIGVAWAGPSGMANRVFAGFEEGMREYAPEYELDVRRELFGRTELLDTYYEFNHSKDAMVLLRSSGAKILGEKEPEIPAFFGGANNPVQLGVFETMNEPPGGNVNGATYFLNRADVLRSFKSVYPDMQRVLVMTEKGHTAEYLELNSFKAGCEDVGLDCSFVSVMTREEFLAKAQKQGPDYDAVVITLGVTFDHTVELVRRLPNTPVFTYTSGQVEKGAVAGLVADDRKLGRMLAKAVIRSLRDGVKPGDMMPITDEKPELIINGRQADLLGIGIPAQVSAKIHR